MSSLYYVQLLLLAIIINRIQSTVQYQLRSRRQIVFPTDDDDNNGNPSFAQSPCTTPDRRPGDCVRITSCPVLRRLNNYNRLRRFFCGFERNDEPLVCCPLPNGGIRNPPPPTPPPQRWTTRRPPPTTPRPTRRTTTTVRPIRITRRTTRRPNPQNVRSTTTTPTSGRRMPDFLPKRDCGKSNKTLTRVVGGEEADPGTWPWMTVVYQERRGVKSPDCGGALVTAQHVVTAAHCVVGRRSTTLDPEVLSVRLGEHDLYSDDDGMTPVDVNVQSVMKHDNFNPRTYENDIAVLKLSRPVRFSAKIAPICLPYDDDQLYGDELDDRKAFVAGWGTVTFNGPTSPKLMQASIRVQEQNFCRTAYKDDVTITNVYMCAGMNDGSKDSCQGDSGGPLMIPGQGARFYLIGIVSFGKQCGNPGYPGVYTRVTEFLDWLTPRLRS